MEVYNDWLHRWETEALLGLVESVPYQANIQVVLITNVPLESVQAFKYEWE